MNGFKLKNNMILGVASSATQIDGGDFDHSWNDWYAQGRIKDGSDPAVAAQHTKYWREDFQMLGQLGVKSYRMSIEWAELEPREGEFDEKAIARVKDKIMLLLAQDIQPLVSLHHFTNPMWFEEKGGFEDYDNIMHYLRYVEKVIKCMGHLVSEYITFNEPNIYAVNGYFLGKWPPGQKSPSTTLEVMGNMASAHIKAYRLIHDMRRSMGFKNTKVAFTNQYRVFVPKDPRNPIHKSEAKLMEDLFQNHITRAMLTGEFHKPLKNQGRDRRGCYCDFHAVNYFSRSTVYGAFSEGTVKGGYRSDFGWEIYPKGIIECCEKLLKIVRLPIYITANGVCDLKDSFRSRFIYDHLKILSRSALPIKRYYYWSFTDSFHWTEGCFPRFGLVHVDYETMERSMKRSGEFYSEIIKNHGVTEEMYDEFVAGEEYHI